jgi:hypothetical protein
MSLIGVYVDLQKTKLYVKCKIQHGDGSPLSADESVGPVNLLLQSLFSQKRSSPLGCASLKFIMVKAAIIMKICLLSEYFSWNDFSF